MKLAFTFPGPLRLDISIGLAFLLLLLQLATGTELEFAELTFLAVIFSVLAVNLAGGLRTLAGCCFAIVAVKVFVVAELAKVLSGEPGQSRLEEPFVTMGVEALGMAGLCLASLVCFHFQPKKVLLPNTLDPELLRTISILGFVIGTGSFFVAQFTGVGEDGRVWIGGGSGVLRRISSCAPLAIVAGTACTLATSNGKRLFSIYNAVPFCIQFGIGVLFTSKQGLFDPFFYLAITGIAFGFAWRSLHLVSGVVVILLALFVLFPFGQVARNYTRGPNIHETYRLTVDYLGENLKRPRYLLEQYQDYKGILEEGDTDRYFESPNGFLERMSLIKSADSLISATLRQGPSGWETLGPGLADFVPRIFLPRRYVNVPNELAYKAGVIDEDNLGTCVSFGFAADAFNAFGWSGVAVISLAIGIFLILLTRVLVGDLDRNIWALVLLGAYQIGIAEAPASGVAVLPYQTAWIVTALLGIRLMAHLVLLSKRLLWRTRALSVRKSVGLNASDVTPGSWSQLGPGGQPRPATNDSNDSPHRVSLGGTRMPLRTDSARATL